MPRSADLKAVHSAPELEKYDLLSRKAFQLAAENRCSGCQRGSSVHGQT